MTFRISKYSYNQFKYPAMDKNSIFLLKERNWFNIYGFMYIMFVTTNIWGGFCFYRRIVNDNNLLKEKFENRKSLQLSFDYMIYTQSKKINENSVNQLSLI
jgi:hypothetical protein